MIVKSPKTKCFKNFKPSQIVESRRKAGSSSVDVLYKDVYRDLGNKAVYIVEVYIIGSSKREKARKRVVRF